MAVGVAVAVAIGVAVGVEIGVAIGVAVAVAIGVAVGVEMGVAVAVAVGVAVAVAVGDGVGDGVPSSFKIVRVAGLGLPIVAPPVGPVKVRFTVSLNSALVSPLTVTLNVLSAVSPASQFSVPELGT